MSQIVRNNGPIWMMFGARGRKRGDGTPKRSRESLETFETVEKTWTRVSRCRPVTIVIACDQTAQLARSCLLV
jgi:hypothetical protein